MLGFGYKNAVKEGIKKSTRAVLIGGLFHYTEAKSFGLNERGSAHLYAQMLSQLIYCILIVFSTKVKKKWATPQFVEEYITEEILNYEKENGFSLSFVFENIQMIMTINQLAIIGTGTANQKTRDQAHFQWSAESIQKEDKQADITTLIKLFELKTQEFVNILLIKF